MTHINQRRDTSVNWINADPVLHLGEVGWEKNTLKAKLGDGVTPWTGLDYAVEPLIGLLVDAVTDGDLLHAPTGNAVYDAIAEKIVQTVTNGDTTHSPSADAVFDAIQSAVMGLWDDRGNYDASGNVFPSTGGSGTAGAVVKGDIWTISVAGTLGGTAVDLGDTVRALVDTPGQTASNWAIAENNTGYVAENQANKSNDATMAANSATLYPTQQAAKGYADAKVSDTAYAGSWDGVTTIAPSKNAVYDYLQALVVQTVSNGDTTHVPSADAVFDHVASVAVLNSLADAKGDIIVATAADTFAKKTVGSNGSQLVADSSQGDGLRWTSAFYFEGSGSPEGVVTAPVGSTYADTTNGLLYVKNTGAGNTGWLGLGSNTVTTWTTPTLTNSWVAFGAPYQGPQYRKNGDNVEIRGAVKNGTVNAGIFTLPVGFRPPADVIFVNDQNTAFGVGVVTSAGVVIASAGSNTIQTVNLTFSITA